MAGKKRLDFSLPEPKAACAHLGCQTPSLIRMKLKTGWANLCEFHYVEEHRKKSAQWCAENGLHTTQQKIEFCRKTAGKLLNSMPTAVEHWRRVLREAPVGSIGESYSREALAKLDPASLEERVPGQDDEELAA